MGEAVQETQPDGAQLAGVLQPVEATESEPAKETTREETREQPKPKTNGSGYQPPVDLSGLPDEYREPIEARFAHLSRLMKKNETKYSGELTQWRTLAEEQSKAIEELRGGVGAVVDHLQTKSLADSEAQIKQQMRAAHEAGDTDAYIAANEKLAEIKAKRIDIERQQKAQKEQPKKEAATQYPRSASHLANEAVTDGELDSGDARAVSAWQSETDETGNLLRPWAHTRNPGNPEADPLYRRAIIEAAAVFDEASPWANKSIAEKLEEVDRRMGVAKPRTGQAVMGGNLTIPRKSSKLTLSDDARNLAIRTKFGGPKAKSDDDHVEAYRTYREQLEKVKGSRK